MGNSKTFLFISIDGMTDPLGQSQVLPYLVNLAKKGNRIGIVSCEKRENWELYHQVISTIVAEAGISWDYCFYKTGKPFVSQWENFRALKKLVIRQVKASASPKNMVLHCRSYLAGLIGNDAKNRYGTGFIFDMRGFWADERVEGGIWKKTNPVGSLLYNYFKRREKEMLRSSDAIISLTHKAKIIIGNMALGIDQSKITVIPCCADLEHFSGKNVNPEHLSAIREKFPQLKEKFVLSYVGSLGTWYMTDEMLAFFKLLAEETDAMFLMITRDREELVYEAARKQQIDPQRIVVVGSSRADMPYYISLSTASVFFIKPSFSKSASSPTKMGELLSMEIPIVTNAGVGDVDSIIRDSGCGLIISDFDQNIYKKAISDLLKNSNLYKTKTVDTANTYFSLKEGVEKYAAVYGSFK